MDWIKTSSGEIVNKDNIDSYIPKMSKANADALARSIYDESVAVSTGTRSWESYFELLNKEGNGCVVDLIKNTDDLSKLTGDDLVKANQNARQAAIAHNAALKQQTLGAKAASVAMKGLALVGNVLLSMAIEKIIEWTIKGLDALVTTTEEHQEQLQNLQQEYDEVKQNLEDVNSQIVEYENKIKELEGKTLTPVEGEELQRIKNLNEQLKIEKEVLEEIEKIKKGETSDKAIETINSKKGGMTRMEMIEDYAHSGYVNTQKEIDRIMSADYMTSEEKNYEIKYLREHQDSLRQQALEITSELLEEAKALDQNDTDAKELYDKIQALSAETLTWAKDVDTATNSVNENSDATSNASENTEKMSATLADLEKSSDKIKTLGSAFKELSDDGYITTKTLGEIKTATGLSGDEWKSYETTLLGVKKGSTEFNQTMSDLTYKVLENQLGTDKLANSDKAYIAAVLQENGVLNANAVAQDMITRAKYKQEIQSILTKDATDEEISSLINNANACGTAKNAYLELVAKEILFNNNDLDVSDKVDKLNKIAVAAGVAGIEMDKLNSKLSGVWGNDRKSYAESYGIEVVKAGMTTNGKGQQVENWQYKYNGETYEELSDAIGMAEAGKLIDKISSSVNSVDVNYSGVVKDKKSKDNTLFDDSYYSSIDAWIEEGKKQIKKLKKEQETFNRQFENALDSGNKEQSEILRAKLAENAKAQKDILHEQNEAHRITQRQLLESLYQYAPSLSGKTWDEISEVDLVGIENTLNNKAELASDKDKNQAKYNLNQFKGVVDDLKSLNNVIEDNSNAWWEADENAKSYWQSQIDFQDEYSNEWIDNQKAFDKLSEKEELAAYGRMLNNNRTFQKQILEDTSLSEEAKLALIKEINDKIVEIEKKTYDLRQEIVETLKSDVSDEIEEKISRFEKRNDKKIERLNHELSQYRSLQSLLQSYYDTINAVSDAQHEINKELATSLTLYEYLDEETRKLLFNQEDYNILNDKLLDIQREANSLQEAYNEDILNSSKENIEEITSQYQMQYETLMKSYEIAKADLEVAKKKQQLNNVLAERNVRMFIDGQWQWVANTQDVQNAQNELADAQYQAQKAQASLEQQESLNELTESQDKITTQINYLESDLETIREKWNEIQEQLEQESFSVSAMLSEIADVDSPKLQGIISSVGESLEDFADKLEDVLNDIDGGSGGGGGRAFGGSFIKGVPNTVTVSASHASGTKNTKSGSALMGENGDEVYIESNGRYIPIEQPTLFSNIAAGGKVFNSMQMQNLETLWDLSNFKIPNYGGFVNRNTTSNTTNIDNSYHVHFQNLEIDSGIIDIDALKRFVGIH